MRVLPVVLVPLLHEARHRCDAVVRAHIFDTIGARGPLEHAQPFILVPARAPLDAGFVWAIARRFELAVQWVVKRLSAVGMIAAVGTRLLAAENFAATSPSVLSLVVARRPSLVVARRPSLLEELDLERLGSGRVHGHDRDQMLLGVLEGETPGLVDDKLVLDFLRLGRVDAPEVVEQSMRRRIRHVDHPVGKRLEVGQHPGDGGEGEHLVVSRLEVVGGQELRVHLPLILAR